MPPGPQLLQLDVFPWPSPLSSLRSRILGHPEKFFRPPGKKTPPPGPAGPRPGSMGSGYSITPGRQGGHGLHLTGAVPGCYPGLRPRLFFPRPPSMQARSPRGKISHPPGIPCDGCAGPSGCPRKTPKMSLPPKGDWLFSLRPDLGKRQAGNGERKCQLSSHTRRKGQGNSPNRSAWRRFFTRWTQSNLTSTNAASGRRTRQNQTASLMNRRDFPASTSSKISRSRRPIATTPKNRHLNGK